MTQSEAMQSEAVCVNAHMLRNAHYARTPTLAAHISNTNDTELHKGMITQHLLPLRFQPCQLFTFGVLKQGPLCAFAFTC